VRALGLARPWLSLPLRLARADSAQLRALHAASAEEHVHPEVRVTSSVPPWRARRN